MKSFFLFVLVLLACQTVLGDLTAPEITRLPLTGEGINCAAIDPKTNVIWVASFNPPIHFYEITYTSNSKPEVSYTSPEYGPEVTLSCFLDKSASFLYITTVSSTVLKIRLSDKQLISTYDFGGQENVIFMTLDADQDIAYLTVGSNSIYKFDLTNFEEPVLASWKDTSYQVFPNGILHQDALLTVLNKVSTETDLFVAFDISTGLEFAGETALGDLKSFDICCISDDHLYLSSFPRNTRDVYALDLNTGDLEEATLKSVSDIRTDFLIQRDGVENEAYAVSWGTTAHMYRLNLTDFTILDEEEFTSAEARPFYILQDRSQDLVFAISDSLPYLRGMDADDLEPIPNDDPNNFLLALPYNPNGHRSYLYMLLGKTASFTYRDRIFVCGESHVTEYFPKTGQTGRSVEIAGSCYGLRANSQYLYAHGFDTAYQILLSTFAVRRVLPLDVEGRALSFLELNSATGDLYVIAEKSIFRVDPDEFGVLDTHSFSSNITMDYIYWAGFHDGYLYLGDCNDQGDHTSLVKFDTEQWEATDKIEMSNENCWNTGSFIDPLGGYVYFTDSNLDGETVRVSLSPFEVQETLKFGTRGAYGAAVDLERRQGWFGMRSFDPTIHEVCLDEPLSIRQTLVVDDGFGVIFSGAYDDETQELWFLSELGYLYKFDVEESTCAAGTLMVNLSSLMFLLAVALYLFLH